MSTLLKAPAEPQVCDRCGARSKVVAILQNGILMFCQHHANKYITALMDQGATIANRKED